MGDRIIMSNFGDSFSDEILNSLEATVCSVTYISIYTQDVILCRHVHVLNNWIKLYDYDDTEGLLYLASLTTEIRTQTARLDLTPVQAKETTYICQIFDFEDLSQDFHMVAATAVINNSYILHHMVIFGCEDGKFGIQSYLNP